VILGLEFPPLGHITDWKAIAGDGQWWEINKVVLIYGFAVLFTFLIFQLGNKKQLVPTGAQNLAETSVEFIDEQIILPTIGSHAPKWALPYLLSIFFYIFFCNIFEVVPVIQMPATARIAVPMFLALLTYVIFNAAGMKALGPLKYLKANLFPPGVPAPLYILVTPIEFVSTFLVRPFSLMVRLFANLLAGHILLVTFAVLSAGLFTAQWYAIFLPLPAFAVVFFTAFEVLVSFLQAYVFALLAGVYIGMATSHEH
jgi:F-type H+-transporting ATPase subunit a